MVESNSIELETRMGNSISFAKFLVVGGGGGCILDYSISSGPFSLSIKTSSSKVDFSISFEKFLGGGGVSWIIASALVLFL